MTENTEHHTFGNSTTPGDQFAMIAESTSRSQQQTNNQTLFQGILYRELHWQRFNGRRSKCGALLASGKTVSLLA